MDGTAASASIEATDLLTSQSLDKTPLDKTRGVPSARTTVVKSASQSELTRRQESSQL